MKFDWFLVRPIAEDGNHTVGLVHKICAKTTGIDFSWGLHANIRHT